MSLLAPEAIDIPALPWLPLAQRSELPEVTAIYFVLDADNVVLYIGRTRSLQQRWVNHHRLQHFLPLADVRIAWLAVAERETLMELERLSIVHFNPPVNGLMPVRIPRQPISVPPPTTMADRIVRRREALGFSQRDLADRTGMLPILISRLERGVNTNPHTDVLKRLARALHCSADWLIGLYDEEPPPSTASSQLVGAAS